MIVIPRHSASTIFADIIMLHNIKNRLFHLTGSRFFGNATEKSDWDFFVEYDSELEEILTDHKFVVNNDVRDYLDPMTKMVMTKSYYQSGEFISEDTIKNNPNVPITKIDIQLCHKDEIETKIKIRDFISRMHMRNGLPGNKIERNKIWTMMYHAIKESENSFQSQYW